ncbi:magnesium transporter NIPA-domain-containing protein [Halteromyces radiatus]|uniref:magnesium transporter NIPA-domain-containing protein n=1 Tax=Halteromyces radiatus TaxID=101107 RepID=UPI002220CB2E|nr:magnesium transporter NIPA-domain-containing protein [Halteromyces radiatus]KAI8097498.1 magnesium transporter NIPA-domain-containing protein [Halteromyces radiatus]
MSFKGGIVETDTLIGIALAIAGNVLISIALNIQKLAHNKLSQQKHQEKRPTLYYRSTSHSLSSVESLNDFQYDHNKLISDDTRYLHSKTWWLGIMMMVLGETGNFMAYGFAPASTIAPLGTTTLVSNAILAPCLLDEHFRPRDFFGVLFAVCGAAGVVWSSKTHEVKLSPELVAAALTQIRSIVFYGITLFLIIVLTLLSPDYGAKNIFVDLGIVAVYGAYTVLSTKSLSSLLNLTMYKLFTYPISYILLVVLIFTAVMQIKYLNKALQRFDGVAVIPTQFVLFTISAIIGSAVIYRDFDDEDADHLLKFIFGCLIEFFGVFLITSNRRESNYHANTRDDDSSIHYRHPPSSNVTIHPPSPPSLITAEPSTTTTSSTTPLLHSHYFSSENTGNDNDTIGKRSISSARRSSIFGGISLHSQLASKDDD